MRPPGEFMVNNRRAEIDPQSALAQSVARRFEAIAGYKNVLDERGNALMSVNEKDGPQSKAYSALETKLKRDEQQLERIKMAVRRPISRWAVRTFVLILVAIALAAFEAPANKFLFDMALQSTGLASYAASAAVTAFLLLLAHFAGRSIRQVWSDYRGKIIWSNIVVFLICMAIATGIVGILDGRPSRLRQRGYQHRRSDVRHSGRARQRRRTGPARRCAQ